MKIKRFFSKDMRSVIRMVREELGPDAVILANNQVTGGVEIIAAVDYDESLLQPRDEASRHRSVDQDGASANRESATMSTASSIPASEFKANDSGAADRNPFGESRLSFRKNGQINQDEFDSAIDDLDLEGFSEHFLEAALESEEEITRSPDKLFVGDARTGSASAKTDYTIDRELAEDNVQIGVATEPKSAPAKESASPSQQKVSFYQSEDYRNRSNSQFYRLDGMQMENAVDHIEANLNKTTGAVQGKNSDQENIWSQEPTLVSMRNEIQTLRSLLEQQLTGLAWGETERRNPVRAKLLRQILELDFHSTLARDIADYVGETSDYTNAWQVALTYVTDNLPINADEFSSGGIYALLGPTGAGKTTSVAKLASKFALRYGRNNVAMITVDNYRVGAHEQLKTYARIFDIPLKVATNASTLDEVIRSLGERKYVFIDSAGLNYHDSRMNNQFDLLQNSKHNIQKILVLPSTYHRSTLDEIVRSFSKLKLHSSIITKIDETTSLGGSLATVMKHNLPVSFFCDGQKIPDALHLANAHALVNQSVLIARKTNQPLNRQDVEKAFVRTHRDVLL